eukprot:CCRYP_011619-RB/>CCRYP_011619-RB protein AED:0.07 eAED:0.07 QI:428/1/1/1/0/0/3/109/235
MPNPDSSHRASDGSSDKDGKKEDDSNSSNCDDNGLSQSNANTSEMKKSAETTETSEKNAKDEEITDDAVRDSDTSDVDEIDRKIEEAASDWQKSASKYVKEHIKPESRYKLKKFIDNEMLNKIRLDKSLNHLPKSIGSYVDAKDGRLTPSGKNARERAKSSEQQAEGVDNQEKKAVKFICAPNKLEIGRQLASKGFTDCRTFHSCPVTKISTLDLAHQMERGKGVRERINRPYMP